jgi:hypothetical protein
VERPILRFFLDAGVPDSVGVVFAKNGHTVFYHRDHLAESTVDKLVCVQALKMDAILVGIDRDMKEFPRRFGVSPNNDRFERLSIIRLLQRNTGRTPLGASDDAY